MNLDKDLQLILQVGAKVYCTETERQGKVTTIDDSTVVVNYGHGGDSELKSYASQAFTDKLLADTIVAGYRLTIGRGNKFVVKPRLNSNAGSTTPTEPAQPISIQAPEKKPDLEIGYIELKLGKFSKKPKKGYVKIEYKVVTEKVTLDLTSEQMAKLKELGML